MNKNVLDKIMDYDKEIDSMQREFAEIFYQLDNAEYGAESVSARPEMLRQSNYLESKIEQTTKAINDLAFENFLMVDLNTKTVQNLPRKDYEKIFEAKTEEVQKLKESVKNFDQKAFAAKAAGNIDEASQWAKLSSVYNRKAEDLSSKLESISRRAVTHMFPEDRINAWSPKCEQPKNLEKSEKFQVK